MRNSKKKLALLSVGLPLVVCGIAFGVIGPAIGSNPSPYALAGFLLPGLILMFLGLHKPRNE